MTDPVLPIVAGGHCVGFFAAPESRLGVVHINHFTRYFGEPRFRTTIRLGKKSSKDHPGLIVPAPNRLRGSSDGAVLDH